jgi:hypothetical protein
MEYASKHPDILTPIELEKWAYSVAENSSEKSYLQNLEGVSLESIEQHKLHALSEIIPPELLPNVLKKLKEYRFVEEINELYLGKYIRWIRIPENYNNSYIVPKITNGGIVTDIRFLKNGVHIQCKNIKNIFIQYKFDECLTFQKLSAEEMFILHTNSNTK